VAAKSKLDMLANTRCPTNPQQHQKHDVHADGRHHHRDGVGGAQPEPHPVTSDGSL
jgi:hypothetical protein